MRIIIDGYNLIRQSPSLSQIDCHDLEAGRMELVRRLSDYQRRKRHQIQVVFDGAEGGHFSPQQERTQGISVTFSRKGETADEVIKRLAASGREGVVIVTSDRELAAFAERQGAAAIRAEDFEHRMMGSHQRLAKDEPIEEEVNSASRKKKGTARRLPKARRKREAKLLQL
jgi:predicted RNA-binding protein with PIN domain